MARRPTVISSEVWEKLAPKQQEVVAFLAQNSGKEFSAGEIQKGARLTNLRVSDVFNLGIKVGNLKSTFDIAWRADEKGRNFFKFVEGGRARRT